MQGTRGICIEICMEYINAQLCLGEKAGGGKRDVSVVDVVDPPPLSPRLPNFSRWGDKWRWLASRLAPASHV
jgi:hypothetical protein